MWYAFNSQEKCIGSFAHKPSDTELSERNAKAYEYADAVNISQVKLIGGVIKIETKKSK